MNSPRRYLYAEMARWLSILVLPEDKYMELHPVEESGVVPLQQAQNAPLEEADYVILNGILHYQEDIQTYLEQLRDKMQAK